ncbi:MAG: VPLPA-CTERM sorting domain-containing protein [Pseudomonadota bacterium]
MKLKTFAVAAAVTFGLASVASAGTVHFDDYEGWTTGENTYTGSDGVEFYVDGVVHDGSGNVYQYFSDNYVSTKDWGNGAGVHSYYDNYHGVGGGYYDEALAVEASERISITSLVFSYVDRNDHFEIYVDEHGTMTDITNYAGGYHWIGGNRWGYGSESVADGDFAMSTGMSYLIGVNDHSDDWKLKSIHYEIAPVPLPAAGFMLLAGLGGLGLMRARQKRQQA